ncbi:MAG: helix-turn-helix domain containing protein [Candidatus Rhabdochlamydia sp.]
MARNSFEKFKIIRNVHDNTSSIIQVSQAQEIPIRTLQRWLKQYKEKGLKGLERKKRIDKGQPRHLPLQLLEHAQRLALEKPKKSIASIY